MIKKKTNTGGVKPENTEEGEIPNTKLRGGCSVANIDRVGGNVNHSGKREDEYILSLESVDIAEENMINGDGMILCNWIAKGGGGFIRN